MKRELVETTASKEHHSVC